MAYCRYCGKEINEGQRFCINCGAPASEEKQQNYSGYNGYNAYNGNNTYNGYSAYNGGMPEQKGKLSVGMLIWSIVNIVVLQQLAAGIIALIFAVLVNGAEPAQAKKYRKVSLILNIVATALGVLSVLLLLFIYFLAFLAAFSGPVL